MELEDVMGVRWICYVVPHQKTRQQAHFLLHEYQVAGQYVFIASFDDPYRAARLHEAIKTIVQHEHNACRNPAWLPSGILTCTSSHLCLREDYLNTCYKRSRMDIWHVRVETNPKKQAEQLLRSGIASNRYLLLRALDSNARSEQLVRSLIEYLDEGVFTRFIGPNRIACPPPLGLFLYTGRCLRCESSYAFERDVPNE